MNGPDQATRVVVELTQRTDLPVGDLLEAAQALYKGSPAGSAKREHATQLLAELVEREDLSVEQRIERHGSSIPAALPGRRASSAPSSCWSSKLWRSARISRSSSGSKRQRLSTRRSPAGSAGKQHAPNCWWRLAEREDLSVEQRIEAAGSLHAEPCRVGGRAARHQLLVELAAREDLSVEQRIEAARLLYTGIPAGSAGEQRRHSAAGRSWRSARISRSSSGSKRHGSLLGQPCRVGGQAARAQLLAGV